MRKTRLAQAVALLVGGMGLGATAQAAPQYYLGLQVASMKGTGHKFDATPSGDVNRVDAPSHGMVGFLAGVNFRQAQWLYGVEADLAFSAKPRVQKDCNEGYYYLCSMPSDYHVRGRLGYSINATDIYLAAGYAGTNATMNYPVKMVQGRLSGYTFGAGADHSFAKNFSARLEVVQDKYNKRTLGDGYGMKDWKDMSIRAAAIFTF